MPPFEETGKQLALATQAAALSVLPFSGRGEKNAADHAAVEQMRKSLDSLDLNIRILLGEGEKDQAPMLFSGERLGRLKTGSAPMLDLVVDPLECTTNFARGLPDSLSVILAASAGEIQEVPGTYMEQMLLPPGSSAGLDAPLDLDTPVEEILEAVSRALNCAVSDICAVVQDRDRHRELIYRIRKAGAGVGMIDSGSISAACQIISGEYSRWNLLLGTFGAPEGLMLAFMAKEAGYEFAGRIAPHDEDSRRKTTALSLLNRTLRENEWIKNSGALVMSGIHESVWLPGVQRIPGPSLKVFSLLWVHGKRIRLTHVDGSLSESLDV